ncbi:MAG: hypothetical protein WDO13_00630 [Verrucomicrobiota bacterium]
MKALSRPAFLALLLSAGPSAAPLFAASGTWSALNTGTYDWSNTGNWQGGTVASGQGAVATIPQQNSASTGVTINLDTDETVGVLNFSGKYGGYTISTTSSNTLTIDNGASSGTISLASGSKAASISVPIVLNGDLAITDAATTGINISGNITGNHNITLDNTSTGIIALTNGSGLINNAGTITNISSGSGGVGLNVNDLGGNVTKVVQDSATSGMSLGGSSSTTFVGTVEVDAGSLHPANALGTSNLLVVNSGATADMVNANLTVAGINDGASGGGTVTVSGTGVKLLTIGGTGTYSFSGALTGNIQLGISAGTTQTLGGTNTYNGSTSTTSVSGTLVVSGDSSAVTHTFTVNNGGTLNVTGLLGAPIAVSSGGTLGGNGSTTGAATISGGGNINLVDNGIGTLTVGGLTSGGTSSAAGSFTFEIGTSLGSVDNISTGSLTLSNANGTKIYIDNLNGVGSQGLVNGTYDLITYSGALTGSLSDLSLQTTSLDGHTLSLTSLASGELVLTVSGGSSTSYYYTGGTSTDFTDYHNYNTDASSQVQQSTALSSTSDVFIGTSNPTPGNIAPTVGANPIAINSLNFTSTGAGGSVNGTGTLTLEGTADGTVTNGITDSAGGTGTETLAAPIALGADQTWSVSGSGDTLQETGGIHGGHKLTLSGGGAFNFTNGSSDYSGGTAVGSGTKLFINNASGTSALGTGPLTVARGATFGGKGTANGLASFAIGSGGSGITQVQVGSGGIDTTSTLTLGASGSSTINNANLTFNLSSTTPHQANLLDLGSTPVSFLNGNTTLTLNITGGDIIAAGTTFVLIKDTDGFAGLNVAQGSDGLITSGLSIAGSTFFGASDGSGFTSGFYGNSFLSVIDNGQEIEVTVVPEPSNWALMIGGLSVLIYWQHRRSKRDLSA